jgi:general secretion pathway protein G
MKEKKRQYKRAFTMVELMAVLIILGLLMAVVVQNFGGSVTKGRITTTKANLRLLHTAVNQFHMDTGRWPTEDEGLTSLIQQPTDVKNWETGGYLETTDLPKDGWGNDFVYVQYPEGGKPFLIKSLGADGQEGGEGENADLLSTDAS